jgi:hypothetical protein
MLTIIGIQLEYQSTYVIGFISEVVPERFTTVNLEGFYGI